MITSPSGKIYIGSTKNIKSRWNEYELLHCKNQIKLYRSFLKYGVKNHIFEVVWVGNINEMLEKETIIGNWYDVLNKNIGLNLKLPKLGDFYKCISEEVRENLSFKLKNRIFTDSQ